MVLKLNNSKIAVFKKKDLKLKKKMLTKTYFFKTSENTLKVFLIRQLRLQLLCFCNVTIIKKDKKNCLVVFFLLILFNSLW